MKKNDNLIHYTAEDIQRYLTGQISIAEMHAMEKAALHDPFLAEAIEGYQHAASFKTTFPKHRQMLDGARNKLNNRTARRWKRQWLTAAALLLLVAVVLTLHELPQRTGQSSPVVVAPASLPAVPAGTDTSAAASPAPTLSSPVLALTTPMVSTKKGTSIKEEKEQEKIRRTDSIQMAANTIYTATEKIKPALTAAKNPPAYFEGRVTDSSNTPIPLAILFFKGYTTYTDNKGYFNIASEDSAIDIQAAASNYSPRVVTLHRNTYQQIILNKAFLKKDTTRDYYGTLDKVEVLEKNGAVPRDGWTSYLAYLNYQLAGSVYDDGIPVRGEMILSFRVDHLANPVAFSFEQSFDQNVDYAVMRLIEQGPKWRITSEIPGSIRLKITF